MTCFSLKFFFPSFFYWSFADSLINQSTFAPSLLLLPASLSFLLLLRPCTSTLIINRKNWLATFCFAVQFAGAVLMKEKREEEWPSCSCCILVYVGKIIAKDSPACHICINYNTGSSANQLLIHHLIDCYIVYKYKIVFLFKMARLNAWHTI